MITIMIKVRTKVRTGKGSVCIPDQHIVVQFFTIYAKVNLESIKLLSNKGLKLFPELVFTKEGKLFQSLTNLFFF